MSNRFLICAPIILTALCSNAVAEEDVTAQCALTYKSSVNAKGPCTIFTAESIVRIRGTVEENGQLYTAIIDSSKNTGLLIGAGTFTLADGQLSKNEPNEANWPNGYVLKIERK